MFNNIVFNNIVFNNIVFNNIVFNNIVYYIYMKKSSHHKIGGCSGTRYGCCPNSGVTKTDPNGRNCYHHRRPSSRIQYIGYHPRDVYPVYRQPITRQEIIRLPNDSTDSTNSDIFHIFNLILVFLILMFSILMAVRFLK